MHNIKKKLLIGLLVLVILTPAGILLPKLFDAGDAWGEWSTEKVKNDVGYEPKGMKKDATLWIAPLPDYSDGKEDNTLFSKSVYYILSGVAGIGIIAISTWILLKFYKKHE